MTVIDLKQLPAVFRGEDGSLDPARVFAVLGVESRESLMELLLYMYANEPQFRLLADIKLLVMAVAALEGETIPRWDLPKFTSADFYRAEGFCKACPGILEKIELAGKLVDRCQIKIDDKLVACEAYRLVALDKPSKEEDLDLLRRMALEAQVDPNHLQLGGYVEDPMHEARVKKIVGILLTQEDMPNTDEEFYRIAKSRGVDEGLTFKEFQKLYNPQRVVFKYLAPVGLVKVANGRISLLGRDGLMHKHVYVSATGEILFVGDSPKEASPKDDHDPVIEIVEIAKLDPDGEVIVERQVDLMQVVPLKRTATDVVKSLFAVVILP